MNNSAENASKDMAKVEKTIKSLEATLIQKSKAGDLEAFSDLIKQYQDFVYSNVFNLCQQTDVADDITQQTFIKAWKGIKNFEETSKISTWLFRIAQNALKDHFRKIKPITIDIDDVQFNQTQIDPTLSLASSQFKTPDEELMHKESITAFKNALNQLTEVQKTTLILKEVNGLSYKEIADYMNCQIGTVMSRLHTARQTLRILLTRHEL